MQQRECVESGLHARHDDGYPHVPVGVHRLADDQCTDEKQHEERARNRERFLHSRHILPDSMWNGVSMDTI